MKKSIFAAAAIAAMALATPAMAEDFTGVRVEVTAGTDLDNAKIRNLANDVTYGAAVGLDTTFMSDNVIVGVEATVDNAFDYRDYGVSARLGYKVADSALVYGKVGYADFRGLEGVRLGGGVEVALGSGFYTKAEYRYADLERNVGRHQALAGFGVRF
jgi:opacity protein-like surface antigen